jgi:hypothetical protein
MAPAVAILKRWMRVCAGATPAEIIFDVFGVRTSQLDNGDVNVDVVEILNSPLAGVVRLLFIYRGSGIN